MLLSQPVATYPHLHYPQQQHAHHPTAQQHHVYAPELAYQNPLLLATGYRPIHLPIPQQHQVSAVAAEQQQLALAQQQAAAAAGGGFAPNPNPRLHHQSLPITHRPRRAPRQQHPPQPNMAYQEGTDEYAELQKLSNTYEPEATGPLVGERQPSTAITSEYANADLVYQAKTAALPQKYSHYRTVRGDGRCGWRAVAFGYLERLLHIGDTNKFLEEETRLRSLSNVLNAAGFEAYLYEDFAEELFELMRELGAALGKGDGDALLHEKFNDESIQNCVITHMKTLTAAWMKTHPENYTGWMIGQTVDQYCSESIMPMGSEIEHIGLSALKDVLLSPAQIALEVMYLDRSAGDEVNLHRFDPISGYTYATVRLLYRPGHYDLLYKMEDVPAPPESIPTYLQFGSSQTYHEPIGHYGAVDDFMTMIPGMSFANSPNGWLSASSYGSDFFAAPTPAQSCVQHLPTPVAAPVQPQLQPQVTHQQVYAPPTPSELAPPISLHHDLPVRSVQHAAHAPVPLATYQHHLPGGPFRSSAYELEPGFVQATSYRPLETAQFKNSHYNLAHFQNPDFQPEEWKPDDEYVTTSTKSRHKPSG